jgi:hypothetical protein
MFIPGFEYKQSIEKGRSEFQHPKRTLNNFGPEMDRFSFWVIITAIEALKVDKTLWREVMQGGFNTLDNFLFTLQDFLNPDQSLLFKRLHKLNSPSLHFYLETLRWLCSSSFSTIPIPSLYNNSNKSLTTTAAGNNKYVNVGQGNNRIITGYKYLITTNIGNAAVLNSSFQRIGVTPLEIDKRDYQGKTILISNGKETKRITLAENNIIEINFY